MARKRDLLFIAVFLVLLLAPLLIKVFRIPVDETNSEKRAIKPAPAFSLEHAHASSGPWNVFQGFNEDLTTYKTSFDEYYTDNFKLKNNLFDLYVATRRGLLGGNPIPHDVIEGDNGWFFLGDSYCSTMREYVGLDTFKQEEVMKIKRFLDQISAWMKAKHIGFYVVIPPDKQQIYGNHLSLVKAANPTKMEQLLGIARGQDYPFIDLQPVLAKHKEAKTFFKTDTHWNSYGAFIGFQTLTGELRKSYPEIPALTLQDFSIETRTVDQKDLTDMLRIRIKDEEPVFHYRIPEYGDRQKNRLEPVLKRGASPDNYEARYANGQRKLKVLVFGDSYVRTWYPYFKECFGESVFIKDFIVDTALIRKEEPDIVIYERVQRDVDAFLSNADSMHIAAQAR